MAAGLPAAAMLLAAGLGLLLVFGWHVPVISMEQLLPLFLLAAALLVAVLGALRGQATPLGVALTAFVLAGAGCQILAERLAAPPLPPLLLALGVALLSGVMAWAAELGMAAASPFLARLISCIALGGVAGTLAGCGVATYGLAAGCVTAGVGAPIVLSCWRSPIAGVPGIAVAAMSWIFVTLGLLSQLPRAPSVILLPAAGALGLAFASGNLMRMKALQRHPRLGMALVIATASVLVGAGIAWIALVGQPDRSPAEEGMY